MTTLLSKMLARSGKSVEDIQPSTKLGKVLRRHGVRTSGELERIKRLPRRELDLESTELAEGLTEWLRASGGEMTLRPVQAIALAELHDFGGLVAPIRVGGGKTLITMMAAVVLECERPLLLVPAKLKRKTQIDAEMLAEHWDIWVPKIMSYELLGRAAHSQALEDYAPDLIISDEAHKLKNTKAAVTRRVSRYMLAHPKTHFVAMSGTITKRSLRDYAHLCEWALGEKQSPVPLVWSILEEWSDALDEKVPDGKRLAPGALIELCDSSEQELYRTDSLMAVRRAFQRRLMSTPAVVSTAESQVDCSLIIEAVEPKYTDKTEEVFSHLRSYWETPDGWPIVDGVGLWRHAREMACGFYYVWDPRPPNEWMAARQAWGASARQILKHNRRGLDSELQVAQACDRGDYPDAAGALADWRAIRASFKPNTVPEWFDPMPMRLAAEWLKKGPQGIVWVEHVAFGRRLSLETGLPYYGRRGETKDGHPIELAEGPIIASILANAEGRNLQAWSRNLVTSCPPNGGMWEQLLGRTHRDGQEADEVSFELLCGSVETWAGFEQARADARYIEDSTGQSQKLNFADIIWPTPTEAAACASSSSRWASSK